MYHLIIPFDNSSKPNEKLVNPRNMSITPAMVNKLTSEGKATAMEQMSGALYYPNVGEGVMPLEFQRGVDINDCWEASFHANRKVRDYVNTQANKSSNES